MMEYSHKQLFSPFSLSLALFVLLLSGKMGIQAEARVHRHHHYEKLFIFGDSYVDTGNSRKDISNSWKVPYGMTFPQKPAGRWSDGRVLTDYVAQFLGLKSPLPYEFRKEAPPQYLKYGMNFAYGGSGVFKTLAPYPNMTTQINFLEQLIEEKVFTLSDLSKSVALVSVAGNDYRYYLANNGTAEGIPSFIASVVNQTIINLIRLQKLGVKKIVVDALQPLGCLPEVTVANSFQHCNSTANNLAVFSNNLLNQSVTKLNQEAKDHSTFVILDLYKSFLSVLNNPPASNTTNLLKLCCAGVSSEYFCSNVDENNVKKYVVCENVQAAFFWDTFHPTQAGWKAVYNNLQTNDLRRLKY
ncbi:GDSL esterase/lipase At5g03610-like isoform X2 [Lotus japonicus]|uniref:GDSL esterase/lipase At5g03610-like isoform X2 n=1 Tax=Lotus japonicus TaxID=34305 RepID=UPI00258E8447|nr:GDSL esterase/lipase At5g03610-like isoform X2 [Lotus japonicus]